ncbi:transcriptional regulator [Halosolutus amylolyticus]|uniref:Transcriptional regulator n=1 Tax=Halosolutus amylolyticus TaxID=2932267 RepID=A0ABD5PUL1_9EURY|nr:transcriptional regulator [Halosolutus amylolyticus]
MTPNDSDDPNHETESRAAEQESFGRLAHEVRLEILAALAAGAPLQYADLFDRSSATDRGRFNYHLRNLRDGYVQDTDEGYDLTHQGRWATNVLAARVLGPADDLPVAEIDSRCGNCGRSAVEMGYRDGECVVRCRSCERTLSRFDFPPGAAHARSRESLAEAYAARTRHYVTLADDGVCPFCAGRMRSAIRPGAATHPESLPVVFDCSGCSAALRAPIGLVLTNRPAVSTRLREHGIEPTDRPFWEYEWGTFSAPTLAGTDPLVAALELPSGDDSWTVFVGADVVIRERSGDVADGAR